MRLAQRTKSGRYYVGKSEEILNSRAFRKLRGKVQLILTSPPFPLNEKKSYGNMTGERYLQWFTSLAPLLAEMLTEDGSEALHCDMYDSALFPVALVNKLVSLSAHPSQRILQKFASQTISR